MHWPYARLPVTAHPFFDATAGTTQIVNGRGILCGWSFRATVAGNFDVFDGPAANGLIIGASFVSATAVAPPWFSERGVYFDNGLTVVVNLGTLRGAVWYLAETRLSEWIVDQESRAGIVARNTQNWPDTVADMIGE